MHSTSFLGTTVRVTIDRPLGSRHPRYGDRYPVNYGYLAGVMSGDGEELDAYVLAVNEPLETFEGTCIAVLRRKSEADDKLIVVPAGVRLSEAEIRRQIDFQERHFESEMLLAAE